jgi:hypothetical protein
MRHKWVLVSVCLEIVLILTQGRCTVCAEHTIISEIILDAPDGCPRRHWSCGISFRKSFYTHPIEHLGEWVMWNLFSVRLEIVLVSMQDRCTVCAKHTIGSKIILDGPDDIPR